MTRGPGQAGSLAVTQAAVLCVLALLVGVATVRGAVLLRAVRVAGAAADGAALAAVTASRPGAATTPGAAADRIARAHGATVLACDCRGPTARVRVVLPVDDRLLGLLGIDRVHAAADATLVPDGPGPAPSPPRAAAGATAPILWFTRWPRGTGTAGPGVRPRRPP